jgi:hypothetical protein
MHERSEATGLIDLAVRVIRKESEKAFNVCLDDGRIWWLPKSQVTDAEQYQAGDRECTMTIPEWLYDLKEKEAADSGEGLGL